MPDKSHGHGSTPVRDIIVIGASSGGAAALLRLAAGLSGNLPVSIFIVVHISPSVRDSLPVLLSHAGPIPAAHARDGEAILHGRIYVAPPDRHLLIEPGCVRLSSGPRENHARPAVDPLFRSAALAYGSRVIGVVLSGALSDGTAGLWEIKQRGGIAIVQDPGDAAYPSMPHSAMDQVPVDFVLPVDEISDLLARLAGARGRMAGRKATGNDVLVMEKPVETTAEIGNANLSLENKSDLPVVSHDMAAQVNGERDGAIAVYVCPDCGGTLWQVNAGAVIRFRCHVGHMYSGDKLLEGYADDAERSLWHSVRSLRDKANLTRQLASTARRRANTEEAAHYEEKARLDEEHSITIRQMIGHDLPVDLPSP